MNCVTLTEFIQISGLSDRALVWLLSRNLLPCAVDAERGLLIDIDDVNLQELMQAVARGVDERLAARQTLIVERFARVVKTRLAGILAEALATTQKTGQAEEAE